MGGDEISQPPLKKMSLGEELENLCKYYMAMGVSYDDYWHGDYCKLKFIEETYFNNMNKRNSELWLQGIYFYRAFSSVLSAAFSKRSSIEYPSQPIDLGFGDYSKTAKEKQAEEIRKIQAQLERQKRAWKAKHKESQ